MRKVRTVESLEAIVGPPRALILLKSIDALDDGCRAVLAHAPVAWFGFRTGGGAPRTTLIGGTAGFVRVESPTRVSFDLNLDLDLDPAEGEPVGGVSFVFMVPGIGETLRLNGSVIGRSGPAVTVGVEEAFVHCARCVLRSGLWRQARTGLPAGLPPARPSRDPAEIAGFLAASPFLAVSSWDGDGFGDTSPRGDGPGFVRVLGDGTLAVPDRRGNQRTDTFHNVLSCDRISFAAVVPGRAEVLHVRGRATVTDEPDLLDTMALGGKAPKAALLVRVEAAEIAGNEAVRAARLWDTPPDHSAVPDLMRLAAQHLVGNKETALSRGLAAVPGRLLRRGVDLGYRRQLKDEGY